MLYFLKKSLSNGNLGIMFEEKPHSVKPHLIRGFLWFLLAVPLYILGLHSSTPKIVSVLSLLLGTYVILIRSMLELCIAALHAEANRRWEEEAEDDN